MSRLHLDWNDAFSLHCDDGKAFGVYVIWNVSMLGASVVYVGSGRIAERLLYHGTN